MEGITNLVAASLARNGFVFRIDHRRLQWSNSELTAIPSKAGIYAIGKESNADPSHLQVSSIAETEDLGTTLPRLSLEDRVYVRFCVVEDAEQRLAIRNSLEKSMLAESFQLPGNLPVHNFENQELKTKN